MSTFRNYLSTIPRIDRCAKEGAYVLLRVDINSPVDPRTRTIIDDYRIVCHLETIKYLLDKNVRVVILAHQGRPGRTDFTSLELHYEILRKHLENRIKFVDDVIGPKARELIKQLKPGEALLLDNVRFLSEELIERRIEQQAQTYLVQKLSPLFDYFVFDGFAVAHRSQPSVVGFPLKLPSCMGLVLEKELNALARIESLSGRKTLVVGGSKAEDVLPIIDAVLKNNLFDKVLTAGLIGVVFIAAKHGILTPALRRTLEMYGLISYVDYAKTLLSKWFDRIEIPLDVAINLNGIRLEVDPYSISEEVLDVGSATLRHYLEILRKSDLIVISGPLGYIEDSAFTKGTRNLFEELVTYKSYKVVCGGHTVSVLRKLNLVSMIDHVSTGGKAFIEALVNKDLPALKALEISSKIFWR